VDKCELSFRHSNSMHSQVPVLQTTLELYVILVLADFLPSIYPLFIFRSIHTAENASNQNHRGQKAAHGLWIKLFMYLFIAFLFSFHLERRRENEGWASKGPRNLLQLVVHTFTNILCTSSQGQELQKINYSVGSQRQRVDFVIVSVLYRSRYYIANTLESDK
jgi:heme/copper-type cytochrome/quinol oxidase subunit 3